MLWPLIGRTKEGDSRTPLAMQAMLLDVPNTVKYFDENVPCWPFCPAEPTERGLCLLTLGISGSVLRTMVSTYEINAGLIWNRAG